jgi:hypothetical protein
LVERAEVERETHLDEIEFIAPDRAFEHRRGEHLFVRQFDAVRFDRAVDQRANAVVALACERELH